MEEQTTPRADPNLYRAVVRGDINYLRMRVQEEDNSGVKLLVTPQENTVLHVAASFGHHEMAQIICEHFPSILTKTNINGDTALHNAAREGHLRVVDVLIKFAKSERRDQLETGNVEKVLLRMINEDGNTALMEATRKGHKTVAKQLIEEDGESLNLVNKLGESVLYMAAERGLHEVVTQLLGVTILHDRILHESTQGMTPLHAAVIKKHTDIINILVEKMPELLESRDVAGRSSLHYAAYLGKVDVLRCLLCNSNARINHHHHGDNGGAFPIHMAAMKGYVNVIQELLLHVPDSSELLDHETRNFLHVAVLNDEGNVVKFVLRTPDLGKLLNEKDKYGNTPLHIATIDGRAHIANLLAGDNRVDIGVVNKEDLTPYEAGKVGKHSFKKYLAIMVFQFTRASQSVRRLDIKEHSSPNKASPKYTADRVNFLVVVATLIITVSFAAGFIIPGEGEGSHNNNNNNNKGMTSMLTEVIKSVYVISNTIALYTSMGAAICLVWVSLGGIEVQNSMLEWILTLLDISLAMVAVTFIAGVNLVVSKLSWLVVIITVTSFICLLSILALIIPIQVPAVPNRWTWLISYLSFRLMLLITKHDIDLDIDLQSM